MAVSAAARTNAEPVMFVDTRINELLSLALTANRQAQEGDIVPITIQRARSQAKNPYAGPRDTALLAAYAGSKCVAYVGLMPGLLRNGDRMERMHWLTALYVDPAYRGTGLGEALVMKAASGRDIAGTAVSPPAEKLYRRLNFQPVGPLEYFILDVRRFDVLSRCLRMIQKALSRLKLGGSILDSSLRGSGRIFDALGKRAVYGLLSAGAGSPLDDIRVEEAASIDPAEPSAPAANDVRRAPRSEFHRGTEILNWMLQDKWVLEGDEPASRPPAYHFADTRSLFRFFALKVTSAASGEQKGFVILSISSEAGRRVLKVLDYHFKDPGDNRYAFLLAMRYARRYQSDTIEFPSDLGPYAKAGPITRFALSNASRIYFCSFSGDNSPLRGALASIRLSYCDGDTAFT